MTSASAPWPSALDIQAVCSDFLVQDMADRLRQPSVEDLERLHQVARKHTPPDFSYLKRVCYQCVYYQIFKQHHDRYSEAIRLVAMEYGEIKIKQHGVRWLDARSS